jgi:hypothetical protein
VAVVDLVILEEQELKVVVVVQVLLQVRLLEVQTLAVAVVPVLMAVIMAAIEQHAQVVQV